MLCSKVQKGTWISVSHSRLLEFVRITRLKASLNKLKIHFWVMSIPKKSLLCQQWLLMVSINKTVNMFRNNIRPLGPSKCSVYVRLLWIGSPSHLIADKVSSSVTRCYNAAIIWTIFTTWAAFHSIHKVVLPIFQQSNLIYEFQCCCNVTYIGHTSQYLEVRVKQHVPRYICNHTTTRYLKLLDSNLCEHLNALNSHFVNHSDECFLVLHRARTKQHLIVIEVIWTAIDRLSIIWKSDLTDKMKRSFFQAAVVSIPLYGCTTWTLTKRLKKKLDGNYTRMLRAILNKSWRQHPTRHQLYGHLPFITKTIQVRRTRLAGHCWRSKDELISDVLLWTPAYGQTKAGRPARTHIQQLCEDTGCNPEDLPKAMNDRERGSGISVLAARHDDDDDDILFNSPSLCKQNPKHCLNLLGDI